MNYYQLRDWKLAFAVGNAADIKKKIPKMEEYSTAKPSGTSNNYPKLKKMEEDESRGLCARHKRGSTAWVRTNTNLATCVYLISWQSFKTLAS